MAAFEFDDARVKQTIEQLEAMRRQLQERQEKILQLANEMERCEGYQLQAAAVRRCGQKVQDRADEMKLCGSTLQAIEEKFVQTELCLSYFIKAGPLPNSEFLRGLNPQIIEPQRITLGEATDTGLIFEESR